MQNLDFSGGMRRGAGITQSLPRQERLGPNENDSRNSGSSSLRRWGFALLLLGIGIFTMGMIAGMRLGSWKKRESEIVRKSTSQPHTQAIRLPGRTAGSTMRRFSDSAPHSTKSLRKTAATTSSTSHSGKYLILLGSYSARNAKRLLYRLTSMPEVQSLRPSPCQSIQESVHNRSAGFRLRSPAGKNIQRVYIGCFRRSAQANAFIRTLKSKSGLQAVPMQLIEIK